MRDPRSEYEVKELTTVSRTHWVRVSNVPLQRLQGEPLIPLLRVPAMAPGAPARMDGDEEEQPVEIEVRRYGFRNFWEHDGEMFHAVPEAMFIGKKTGPHSIHACGFCAKHWSDPGPATPLVRRSGDAPGCGKF